MADIIVNLLWAQCGYKPCMLLHLCPSSHRRACMSHTSAAQAAGAERFFQQVRSLLSHLLTCALC